jgi:hypothetical protein
MATTSEVWIDEPNAKIVVIDTGRLTGKPGALVWSFGDFMTTKAKASVPHNGDSNCISGDRR